MQGAVWVSSPLTWEMGDSDDGSRERTGSQWVLRSPAPDSQGCGPGWLVSSGWVSVWLSAGRWASMKVDTLVLFLTLGEKLSIFHH